MLFQEKIDQQRGLSESDSSASIRFRERERDCANATRHICRLRYEGETSARTLCWSNDGRYGPHVSLQSQMSALFRRLSDEWNQGPTLRCLQNGHRRFSNFGHTGFDHDGWRTTSRTVLDVVRHAVEKGLSVNLESNGWLINDVKAAELKRAGIGVAQISLDGPTSAIHDRIRGVPGSFRKAVRAISLLSDNDVAVVVNFTCLRYNTDSAPETALLAEKLGATRFQAQYMLPTGFGLNQGASHSTMRRLAEWIREQNETLQHETFFVIADPLESLISLPLYPTISLHISAEGYVLLYSCLPFSFGNVKNLRLTDLWNRGLNKATKDHRVREAIERLSSERNLLEVGNRIGSDGIHYYVDLLEQPS